MLMMRRCERLEDGKFVAIHFSELKSGDTYRLFDDVQNPIEHGQEYVAASDAEPTEPPGNFVVKNVE